MSDIVQVAQGSVPGEQVRLIRGQVMPLIHV